MKFEYFGLRIYISDSLKRFWY